MRIFGFLFIELSLINLVFYLHCHRRVFEHLIETGELLEEGRVKYHFELVDRAVMFILSNTSPISWGEKPITNYGPVCVFRFAQRATIVFNRVLDVV